MKVSELDKRERDKYQENVEGKRNAMTEGESGAAEEECKLCRKAVLSVHKSMVVETSGGEKWGRELSGDVGN